MPGDQLHESSTTTTTKRKLRSLSASIPYPIKRLCKENVTKHLPLRCNTRRFSQNKFLSNHIFMKSEKSLKMENDFSPISPSNNTTTSTPIKTTREQTENDEEVDHKSLTNSPKHPQSQCLWENCNKTIVCYQGEKDGVELLQHLREQHVYPQNTSKRIKFTCLWNDCRVYGHPSRSLAWLDGHVTKHTALRDRPLACIHEGCYQRFASCEQLQRHVNSHFISPSKSTLSNNGKLYQQVTDNINNSSNDKIKNESIKNLPTNSTGTELIDNQQAQISRKYVGLGNKHRELNRFRRWNRLIGYRVRRTDYLGYHSRQKIRLSLIIDSLNPQKLLSSNDLSSSSSTTTTTTGAATTTTTTTTSSSSPSKHNQNKIPSTSNCSNFPIETNATGNFVEAEILSNSTCLPAATKRLLKIPFEIIGSRSDSTGAMEYLIKWFASEKKSQDCPPQMAQWIKMDDYLLAKSIHSAFLNNKVY